MKTAPADQAGDRLTMMATRTLQSPVGSVRQVGPLRKSDFDRFEMCGCPKLDGYFGFEARMKVASFTRRIR